MNVDDIKLLLQFVIAIGLVLGTYISGRSLWYRHKEIKAMLPQITHIDVDGQKISITIVNNRTHCITLKKTTVKKHLFGPLYSRPISISWIPGKDAKGFPDDPCQYHAALLVAAPDYSVEKQRNIFITLPGTFDAATYKISVLTTGGWCQYIHHCQS